MKSCVLWALLISSAVAEVAQGAPFTKSQTLSLEINGQTSGLSLANNGRQAVVYGDALKYWLITGDKGKQVIMTALVPDKAEYLQPREAITEPDALRGTTKIQDWISQVQWLDDSVVLYAANNTYFYDPLRLVVTHVYPVFNSGHRDQKLWSAKYQLLIHGAELIDRKGTTIQSPQDKSAAVHGYQTGLLLTQDNAQYITAGFHTQDIKVWSLPEGKLEKKFELSGVFSSRKVTDISLFNGQLIVASASGHIEVRSSDNGKMGWSIRPCAEMVRFVSTTQTGNRLFYRCGSDFGYLQNDKGLWSSVQVSVDKGKETLESVTETSIHNMAVLGFSNGKVISYNLKTEKVEQEILPGRAGPVVAPTHVAYLKNTNQLLVVE